MLSAACLRPHCSSVDPGPQGRPDARELPTNGPLSLYLSLSLSLVIHPHSLTISCTWCYDEIKGIQNLEIYSRADSLIFSLSCPVHFPLSLCHATLLLLSVHNCAATASSMMIHSRINEICVLKKREEAKKALVPRALQLCGDVIEKAQECANKSMQAAQATTDVTTGVADAIAKIPDAATTTTCRKYWWHKAMWHELQNNHTLIYISYKVLD